MPDEVKKISEFPGRRPDAPPREDQPAIYLGGDQGSELRPPCGDCIHWKRVPLAGANQGACMLFPPVGFPIPNNKGQFVGQALSRPQLPASYEGCDQHETAEEAAEDDEGDDDDGGEPGALAAMG